MRDLRIQRLRRLAALAIAAPALLATGCTLLPAGSTEPVPGEAQTSSAAPPPSMNAAPAPTAASAQTSTTSADAGAARQPGSNAATGPLAAATPATEAVTNSLPPGNDSRLPTTAPALPDPWAARSALPPFGAASAPQSDAGVTIEAIPPIDLLERVRSAFVLPDAADPSVTRELEWFASHPDYLDRVFGRAGTYLHFIVEALEERGMPLDLALLPVVESAFDPFAYSHGRASGLWQIIPGTGRRLGLKQNWWFDGRRDIAESTRAALDYLQALHTQFSGDWLLAVAGYNSGEGNVARAIARATAAGRPTDFWSLRRDLPAETRTYVPRLIAIRNLVAEPGAFDLTLPEIPDSPVFAAVDTGSQIDMALAAELAGLDIDTLYAFNPGINRWATDPDGPHRLLVPIESAPAFEAALAGLGESERVRWTRHRIGNGETLSQIALKYETTIDVLRDINDIRGNMIRAGQYLMIPHAAESAASYSQSLDARTDRQQSRERTGNRVVHTVRSGDSFWSISQRYGVGVRELASWNAMAPGDTLPIGRELVVWTDADAPAATVARVATQSQVRQVNYVVRRGDSLASIARRFRVTVGKLVEWNRLDPKRYLQPGQRLVMHVDVTEQSS